MSSIWTLPFDMFQGNPSDFSGRIRGFDLKARTYQAMGRFWTRMYRLIRAKKSQADLQAEATTITQDIGADLGKVYGKFKDGEQYNAMNPAERMGDRFAKEAHKLLFGNFPGGDAEMKDIQAALEALWDDFFDLPADDTGKLNGILNRFAVDVWSALGLAVSAAPSFGSSGSTRSRPAATQSDVLLVGKGQVVYLPVVLPKSVIRGMFPAHYLRFETTGLDIDKDQHVVMYVFAKQTVDFGYTKVTYQEVFPSIPYISLPGVKNQLFQAIPVIWVNSVSIAKGAREVWKINKLYADFKEGENFPIDAASGLTTASNQLTTSVEDSTGKFVEQALLKVELHAQGGTKTYAPDEVDSFAKMRKLLDLSSIYWQGEDFYTCTYQIDFSTARLSYATGKVETGDLYGMDCGTHHLESLEKNPIGAFKLDYDWTFGAPSPHPKLGS